MSDPVPEQQDVDENLDERRRTREERASVMFLFIQEVIFVFALVVTSYTALFSSLPKVGMPPPPSPFFPLNSIVADHYKGDLSAMFGKAPRNAITSVMYYAPWDAESQSVRYEYEKTAKLLHKEVYFAAISCWSPTCECKHHLPKIMRFPMIVAYPGKAQGVQFHGPLKSVYMINFLQTMLRPIKRLLSLEDLGELIAKYNIIVLGSFLFNGSLGAPGYDIFHSASRRMLERDPYHDAVFAVTTDEKTAKSMGVQSFPSVKLYVWNETHYYPSPNFTEMDIVLWVWQKIQQVVQWVSPPRVKSRLLYKYLNLGPALILFTPRNPLVEVNPTYNLFRELGLRYFNCYNNHWLSHLVEFMNEKNRNLRDVRKQMDEKCAKRAREKEARRCGITLNPLANITEMEEGDLCYYGGPSWKYFGPQPEMCYKNSKIQWDGVKKCKPESSAEDYVWVDEILETPSLALMDYWEDQKCKILEHADEYYKVPYPKLPGPDFKENITALACANNRTLTFIALDSLIHYQFAEGIGINILHLKGKTAAAIVDTRLESQYVLAGEVNKESLIMFIKNHTENTLDRFQRSTHDSWARTVNRHRYPIRASENCDQTDLESCVPELHANDFLEFVMSDDWASVVFYHSPYCAICRSVSYLFLLLARYFRFFPLIKFARIDGDNNDLPWEYTMDTFPSVVFFPIIHKTGSRVFGENKPFMGMNMVHFVLANLEPEARIPAMMSVCLSFEKVQSDKEGRDCKIKLQKETYDNLSNITKDMKELDIRWQNTPPVSEILPDLREEKKVLDMKMDYFKTVNSLLGSVSKVSMKSSVPQKIINSYGKLVSFLKNSTYYLEYGAPK